MAAGLGFKDFTTGEVLTAADVDGYLMQGVWVFASAAARDAAVTSPQEGNFAYLKDTNVTTYYTGSTWANLDTTGMTNPMTTTADIIYSSSGSTPARLGIGTAGQVLQVNSGATAPEWATPSSGGGITLLSTTNLSGATTTISSISGSYKNLIILIKDFYASSNMDAIMGVNGDNTGANYQQIVVRASGASDGTFATNVDAGAFISGYQVVNSQKDNFAVITIADYANATTRKVINILCNAESPTAKTVTNTTCAYYGAVAAISEINIKASAGTWSAGSVEIYGVN